MPSGSVAEMMKDSHSDLRNISELDRGVSRFEAFGRWARLVHPSHASVLANGIEAPTTQLGARGRACGVRI